MEREVGWLRLKLGGKERRERGELGTVDLRLPDEMCTRLMSLATVGSGGVVIVEIC